MLYQFIVFLQGCEADCVIDANCPEPNVIPMGCEFRENLIHDLSQWDYGEYTEDPVDKEQMLTEIGTSGEIYDSNPDYLLVTYPHSAVCLYKKIKTN